MKYLNGTEPLGLPRGSVRAILALLVAGTAMLLFAAQREVTDGLIGLVGVVLAYYFNSRNADPVNGSSHEPPVPPTEPPPAK